jgi:Glycosyl hydrolases family 6
MTLGRGELSRASYAMILPMRRRFAISLAGLLCAGALIPLSASDASGTTVRAHPAFTQQCAEPYPAKRNAANPLLLAKNPGSDPLKGANFFIDGPAHGDAAGAIATLLGLSPASFSEQESWASFIQSVDTGALHGRLAGNPGLASQVNELAKIAAEPEVERVSAYSQGGGPGAIFLETEDILCRYRLADPGSVPILNTYFLHPAAGVCPTPAELKTAGPVFRRRVDEFAAAVDRRPALLLLETDALGTSRCIFRAGSLPIWEADLRYEIGKLGSLPHAVTYVEGGYEDSNTLSYTARALNAIGVKRIRGFYTNDTHLNWTIKEVGWATKISELTHGAHFIVNTAQNGNGPKLNPHPRTQGVEDLCNPPGRALGPRPTTNTGFKLADAWLWTSPPGNSSGSCGGGPPPGSFWAARAVVLAAHANGRLGPHYPNELY